MQVADSLISLRSERPLLFVAHSLGGLVCEDALVSSSNSAEAHHRALLEATRGIIFMSTPHSGSSLARSGELLAKVAGVLKTANAKIVEDLKCDSEVLARTQIDFHTMIRKRTKEGKPGIEITCFYEKLPLLILGLVVAMQSAVLRSYSSIGIHADHVNMTKFRSADDPGFQAVVAELGLLDISREGAELDDKIELLAR